MIFILPLVRRIKTNTMKLQRIKTAFLIMLSAGIASAQEIFTDEDEVFKKLEPNHLYLSAQGDYSDYITKDESKAMAVSGASTTISLSRFYENSTIGFQSATGLLQIPASVISESTSSTDKGITISGWIRIDDLNANTSIGFLGRAGNKDSVKVDIAVVNKKILIRKRCLGVLCPIIKTDFSVDYDSFRPEKGDLTNGYIYISIASDNKTCRITLSRPGGRLFTRWYYVSLMDNVTSEDSFFWGRSPNTPNSTMNIPAVYDDIMVYNRSLNPEESLMAFYMQSPFYPGVSYYFEAPDGYTPAPSDNRNAEPAFSSLYFKWFADYYKYGAFSSNRWFFHSVSKPSRTSDSRMFFSNARSGGNVYQQTGSYFLYQLLEPSSTYPDRTQYDIKRQIYPQNLYDPDHVTSYNVGTYWFKSVHSPTYCLGWANKDMYLTELEDAYAWRVKAAKKVYGRGAESKLSIPNTESQFVMLRNVGRNKYVDVYWGGEYNYLILKDKDETRNEQKFMIYSTSSTDNGIYKNVYIKSALGLLISSYWGKQDQKEDEYIILHTQDFTWELVYCRNDANDKPLYAIRANNGYGSYLLGYHTSMGTNPYYVCQTSANVYDNAGNVTDDFLWSIEIHKTK